MDDFQKNACVRQATWAHCVWTSAWGEGVNLKKYTFYFLDSMTIFARILLSSKYVQSCSVLYCMSFLKGSLCFHKKSNGQH